MSDLILLLEKKGKPLETIQILGLIELMVERILAATRLLLFISVVLMVVAIGGGSYLEMQIKHNSHNQVQTRKSAVEAKAAAVEAKASAEQVKLVLDGAVNPDTPGNRASADAILRIKAIENRLCGGPCPPAPTTTTIPKG